MRKIITALLLIILAFFGTSCSPPKDPEFREIKHIKIEKLGFSSSKVSMDVVMYNPNNFGLDLDQTDLDIHIDNTFFGHTSQKIQIKIPRKADFIIPIILDVDSKKLLKNGLNVLMNDKVELKAKGSIRLGKAGIYKIYPVDYAGMQTVPKSALFN